MAWMGRDRRGMARQGNIFMNERRLYNTPAWRHLAKRVRDEEPLCRMCRARGIVRPSEVVDHIVPHKGNKALFWDRENLQALCAPCHNAGKQTQERHGYSQAAGVDGLPIDSLHPWNGGRGVLSSEAPHRGTGPVPALHSPTNERRGSRGD